MTDTPLFIGTNPLQNQPRTCTGDFVYQGNEQFYEIKNYDYIPPFFMTLMSSSNHWLFISSNGALTAGRRNPENALFPYYTDDKIHDSKEITGSKTIFRVLKNGKRQLWEPFSDKFAGICKITRNLYKNVYGNKLIFEEINQDLGLEFRYGWFFSDKYGFIRKSWLVNISEEPTEVEILDGIQNLLPYGVHKGMQSELSTLVDAYKKNEKHPDSTLALFLLSSIIVDRAEPSEALKATTVFSLGMENSKILLSTRQVQTFREGKQPEEELETKAARGAYLITAKVTLRPDALKTWTICSDLQQGPSDVALLIKELRNEEELGVHIDADIEAGTNKLLALVASADGFQVGENKSVSNRHFANVLFNIMRGGVFLDNYCIQKNDLIQFMQKFNKVVCQRHADLLNTLPQTTTFTSLISKVEETGDSNLIRLTYEYMPLTFSRRHGDPSRPWNRFDIDVKLEDGTDKLSFQGNWRDIFQNWEALSYSFPGYLKNMICKFLNASTADGYNPYRITREGIDWEITDPDDSWSFIGYWGDHQIIYLLKLMESADKHFPGMLEKMLTESIFAYSNVPYRIKKYEDLVSDPYDTVEFDFNIQSVIEERVANFGSDGKLLFAENEEVYLANMAEKILVSLLAKLSNYIHEGGIWLNTQRPEWNDANNALVGNGVSMVTLYYMNRFINFSSKIFHAADFKKVKVSEEVAELFLRIHQGFETFSEILNHTCDDLARRKLLDKLGIAQSQYRSGIYSGGFSGNKRAIEKGELLDFFQTVNRFVSHSIKANKRPDGLYHSYNLLSFEQDGVSISHLYEMLEGQVAVLTSGALNGEESLEVLKALRLSSMYREDQHSYILYPDRQLPKFLEKNNIPPDFVIQSELLQKLAGDGNRLLVEIDLNGNFHFNGVIRNANDVKDILAKLRESGYAALVDAEQEKLLSVFEDMFNHKAFTGRSGTFFSYEGLGSIYWHMVSKLLLVSGETVAEALKNGASKSTVSELLERYRDIRLGIGFNKTPAEYGAFPTDPYSHTPAHAGAKQPGMTGQVKEDILARFLELGVRVGKGEISFRPTMLTADEFLKKPGTFTFYNLHGQEMTLEIPARSLAFTYCQIPVIYHNSGDQQGILLTLSNGETTRIQGLTLGSVNSARIFDRTGLISKIEVFLMAGLE